MLIPLSPEILLRAYAAGIFPMAESADDPELFWVDPKRRGIIPLDAFHLPRRLLDTQFVTPHLAQFGAIEISRARYHRLLAEALRYRGVFPRDLPGGDAGAAGAAGTGGGSDPLAGLQASRLTS